MHVVYGKVPNKKKIYIYTVSDITSIRNVIYLFEDNELFETIQSTDINQNSNRSYVSFRLRSWEKVTRVLNDIDREKIKFFVFDNVESEGYRGTH